MELAKIEVTRAEARKVHCGKLTSGMVGAEIAFSFDDTWDGLSRIVVFKAGGAVKDVLLTGEICAIPHEVLERPVHLVVGVYGAAADGSVVIPTVWADLGQVEQGVKPSGAVSGKPTPEVWAQILNMVGDLTALNTDARDNLVAAVNEVLSKGADPEEIQNIVNDYLAEHGAGGGIHVGPNPPEDPNVDIWLDTSEDGGNPFLPNTTGAKVGQYFRVAAVDANGVVTNVETVEAPAGGKYELPAATADALGGVKAEPAEEADTQPVRIGGDGKLYTAPGAGGNGGAVSTKWKLLNDITVSEVVDSVTIDADADGKPISARHMLVHMYLPKYDYNGETSTGYSTYAVNGKNISKGNNYCYPASGWADGYFLFDIMACGDLVYVRCYKETNGSRLDEGRTLNDIFHFAINENIGLYDAITSFKWSLFNRKVLIGSTFKVYGEVV